MKCLIPAAAALVCLPFVCSADVDQNQIEAAIQNQFAALYKAEKPTIIMQQATRDYIAVFTKQDVTLRYDKNGIITCITQQPKHPGDDAIALTDDALWALRPDINRQNMVMIYPGRYVMKRPDGLLDNRVNMTIMKSNDIIQGFVARSNINDSQIPPLNITEAQAAATAKHIAENWVVQPRDTRYTWAYQYPAPNNSTAATVYADNAGVASIQYRFSYYLSSTPINNINEYTQNHEGKLPILDITVNGTTGDINECDLLLPRADGDNGVVTQKPLPVISTVDANINGKKLDCAYPFVTVANRIYIAMPTLQSLAKGYIVAAKVGDKTFSLDGKKLALDAKVIDRKGVLYLPCKVLNNLPGINAQFDSKLAKLSVTTEQMSMTLGYEQ